MTIIGLRFGKVEKINVKRKPSFIYINNCQWHEMTMIRTLPKRKAFIGRSKVGIRKGVKVVGTSSGGKLINWWELIT